MFTFLGIFLVLVALGVIGWIVIHKFPQLASMNVEQSSVERLRRLKQHLALNRMARRVRVLKGKIITPENWQRVKYVVQESYQKLRLLEDKYKTHTEEAKIQLLLKRGRAALIDDSELAEQCFLEIIGLDPKHLESYEALSRIYLDRKNIKEAMETLEFLVKLNPAFAGRYLIDIASALLMSGDRKGAWEYATKAIELESSNPKYLDFLIELAIVDGRQREGMQYLEALQGVNPENAKLGELQRRLKELPT